MTSLKIYNRTQINKIIVKRPGESKFGTNVQLLSNVRHIYDQLSRLDVMYVIFGIPEDVGIFANYGKSGSSSAWDAAIKVLLNTQDNIYNDAKKVLLLGHLEFKKELEIVAQLNQKRKKDVQKARELTAQIDKEVTYLVQLIVKAGKIPIVIGGGHNNAYGNIKGASLALNSPINVINLDAHTDFRNEEGRHSGNGFSYAYSEGFLKNYFIFGLHENYTSNAILTKLNKLKSIKYNTYEAIEIRKDLKFSSEINKALKHIASKPYGIEIDCDAIENVPSSAMTPSGFSVTKARRFVHYFGKHENARYLHICEAAPKKKQQQQVGKLLSYLITDFIRANSK